MRRIVAFVLCLLFGCMTQAGATNVPGPPTGGGQSSTGSAGLNASSATCSAANSCLFLAVGSADNIVTLGITGTFSGTVIVEGTADGVTWNALNVLPFGSTASAANITTTGVFQALVSGLVNVRARVSTLSSGAVVITMQGSSSSVGTGGSSTPFTTPCTQSVALNTIGGSGQTQVIALSSGKAIRVCGFHIVAQGTTNVSIQSGTGSNCASNTVTLSGADALVTGMVDNSPGDNNQFTTTASQELCINNSNAVQLGGYITFIQQ